MRCLYIQYMYMLLRGMFTSLFPRRIDECLNGPVFNRGVHTRRSMRERKPVTRTQSAPHRRPGHNRYALKRQTSTEDLQIDGPEQESEPGAAHPLDISSPQTVSDKQLVYCSGIAHRFAEHAGGMWLRG